MIINTLTFFGENIFDSCYTYSNLANLCPIKMPQGKPLKMKKNIVITEEHKAALELIKNSYANIWSHPKGGRGGKDRGDDVCEYCGKPTSKDGKNTMFFQILTSGRIIPNSIDEQIVWDLYNADLIQDQPQGGFPLGSVCAKKLLGKDVEKYHASEPVQPVSKELTREESAGFKAGELSAAKEIEALKKHNKQLTKALTDLAEVFRSGADSGDWGRWRANDVPEYVKAFKLISKKR